MSLFPSATLINEESNQKKSNKDWLENKSFDAAATAILKKDQEKLKNVFDCYSSDKALVKEEKRWENFQSEDSHSTSSDDDSKDAPNNTAEKVQVLEVKIDKLPNKNNLYFSKPYKVNTPKFYRSSTSCIGLSPFLKVTFEKKRKVKYKRDEKTNVRYFHPSEANAKEDEEENLTDSFKVNIERLNIETRENSSNIDAWLQLVALQDEISGKNVKLKTEKKVSILDKAISLNPRNYQLKLKRLHLLESIAEDSDREWKNLVFHHPDCKETWEAYLRHTLATSRFTVPRTLKVYEKCLETLSAVKKQSHQTVAFAQKLERDTMVIFGKLVQFLAESGHNERVIVIMQLMLDINVRSNKCRDMTDVEHFYKANVPLLGEVNSRGWDHWFEKFERGGWVDSSGAVAPVDVEEMEEDVDELIDFDESVNENWLKLERKRGLSNLLPWRSDEDCEDVARKISYDDVKGFLFLVDTDESRVKLVEILLQVWGVLPENLLCSSKLLISQPCQLTHAYHSNDVLGDVDVLRKVTCLECSNNGILPRVPHHDFLQLVFEQLASSCRESIRRRVASFGVGYSSLRMRALAVKDEMKSELKKSYKEARKLAKSFLKVDPGDYAVWAKLSRIEFLFKKPDDARKIIYNSLCMCKDQRDALILCWSYAEKAYRDDSDSVKRVLTAFGDGRDFTGYLQAGKELSAAAVLRAARSIERLIEDFGCTYEKEEAGTVYDASSFADVLRCYILYGHLTSPLPPEVVRNFIQVLRKPRSNGNEQSLVDLRLIHELIIQLTTPCDPSNGFYRNAILNALHDVPDHPLFLLKLSQVEVGSSISSSIRRLSAPSNPIIVFFSVFFEILRSSQIDATFVPPRVINILERSLATHADNILLWRIYTSLSKNPEAILLRASASCPWSKALACDRIRLAKENIDDVLSFMQDKGLRVRTPVEEVRLLLTM